MLMRKFNRFIAVLLLVTFTLSIAAPLPVFSADKGSPESATAEPFKGNKGIKNFIFEKLKPTDGLTVGERADGLVDRIREGEMIMTPKGVNIDGMSPIKASLTLGANSLGKAFSPGKIGLSVASTFGMNVAKQVIKGEKIDLGAAAKELASGKYIGSFIGSGIGGAIGSGAGALLSTSIPVVGPILGAFMPSLFSIAGGQMGAQMGNDVEGGIVPSFKRAWASIDKADLAGRVIGTTVGQVIGSLLLPGIGTAIGGIVGNFIGSKIASLFKKKVEKKDGGSENTNIRFGVTPGGPILNTFPTFDIPADADVMMIADLKGIQAVKVLRDKMVNAYRHYVSLITSPRSSREDCNSALSTFKKLYDEYGKMVRSIRTNGRLEE